MLPATLPERRATLRLVAVYPGAPRQLQEERREHMPARGVSIVSLLLHLSQATTPLALLTAVPPCPELLRLVSGINWQWTALAPQKSDSCCCKHSHAAASTLDMPWFNPDLSA
jgi:hypothetical protein